MKASEEKYKKNKRVEKESLTLGKEKPPVSTKDLFIGPGTGTSEEILKQYLPIIEMVVKKEYKTIPSYLAEYSELINIGLLSVNKLLKEAEKNNKTYNSSYIAQAVKWAIKDELRSKYNWYGVKQTQAKEKSFENDTDAYPKEIASEGDLGSMTEEEATEKVFETILYLDDFTRETVSQDQLTTDELAKLELMELKAAVKRAIDKLPPKHKKVIELRFYEGKRGNDIASWLGVTPSRVSHMIQDAIEKVRQSLLSEGFS
ncbi:MAG: sigma-70 family RNA polymerase sigma factor [Candidatus Melainabacteria bacterium]|nr:sigma-70 family RNA polymerase sigma factor [Candidatus Melainabacteria bacterium]